MSRCKMKNKSIIKKLLPLLIILILTSTQVSGFFTDPPFTFNLNNSDGDLLFNLKIRAIMRIIDTPSLTVCVVDNNSTLWSECYGYSNLYIRQKASLESTYVIGSISKTVTATAIMQLYEQGLFELDDDISLYLPYKVRNPNFPDINITFRMLLTHQSSLGDGFFDFPSYVPLSNDPCEWLKSRLLPGEKYYKEEFWKEYAPGEDMYYSNWGFILVSALVEQISEMTLEDYCQENIFQPLNMNDTSYKKDKLDRKNFARPYYPIFAEIYLPMLNYDIQCASACGGLRTNAVDLSHFMMAHMNNGTWNNFSLLNKSTTKLMHSIQYPNFSAHFYIGVLQHGLGWIHLNISNDVWEGYNGGAIGYSCYMMFRQSDGIGIIMLLNGHFKRLNHKAADTKLNLNYKLAEMFIEKAKKQLIR